MPSDALNYKALCKVEGDAAGNPRRVGRPEGRRGGAGSAATCR